MPILSTVKLHDGHVLWPEHKSEEEVAELRATTSDLIWETTYQGNPSIPGGNIFNRSWWSGQNRYDHSEPRYKNWTIARWLSVDTAMSEKDTAAYSTMTVGELWPDYHLALRHVWRERLAFPDLIDRLLSDIPRWNRDGKMRAMVIEDKASGISAIQTLRKRAPDEVADMIVSFLPAYDKPTRASQAGVWCKNGCVLLPNPGESTPWLLDFEDELFSFPGSMFADQVDAFSQLVLYLENILAEGWRSRGA